MLGDRAARWPSTLPLTLAASRRDRRRRCTTYVGARALCAVVSHIALDDQSVTIAHTHIGEVTWGARATPCITPWEARGERRRARGRYDTVPNK